jgi:hypothetical protein
MYVYTAMKIIISKKIQKYIPVLLVKILYTYIYIYFINIITVIDPKVQHPGINIAPRLLSILTSGLFFWLNRASHSVGRVAKLQLKNLNG